MKKVLLLFQMGSEVRQFGHSGFISQLLANGWEVLVATRFPVQEFSSQLDPRVQVVILPQARPDFWYSQLAVVLDKVQGLRRRKLGWTTWVYGKSAPKKFRHKLRLWLQDLFSWILSTFPFLFRMAQNLEMARSHSRGQKEYGDFLSLHEPDAVVVSVPRLKYQAHLLSAAKELGIPRYLFYHTNKDIVAFSRLDHDFTAIGVWNQWMKDNLLLQNPGLKEHKVFITGCAHFDCIGRADLLSPEAEFRSRLGVRAFDQLVLYTAAGPAVLPQEECFIEVVLDALKSLPEFHPRLVVRLNPMDDSPRIEEYLRTHRPEVIVLRPDWHYTRSQNLCYQKVDDVKVWNDLLHNSTVCVNIPSTVTIECALAGLPVINLGFDLPGLNPLPGSVRAFWDVDYYAHIRETGAALLAENQESLPGLLLQCMKDRKILLSEQENLIRQELNSIHPAQATRQYLQVIEKHLAR